MYDVVVVGARCAGAPAAMLLARAGHRVLLLERARFPRDTLSTLYIHQPGVALLERWGILDDVVATGCPPITRAVHQVADVRLEGCTWPVEGIRAAYAPRRYLLDQVLARHAAGAGVEFRQGCHVEDVVVEDGRAVGVRYRTATGPHVAHAALVIGADGMRSRVAERVAAPVTVEDPLMTCVYYSFWRDVDAGFEAYGARGRWAGCAPTNDGLTLVAAYFPQSEFSRVRSAAAAAHLDCLRGVAPELHDRVRAGTQVDRLYGTGAQRNFFRQAAGPGWALVGDAGHHKDSITANGICDAFRQAQLLVDHVGGTDLRDAARLRAALDRYTTDRDAMFTPSYHDTLAVARLRPDRRLATLRAIAGDPARVERFFATMAGAGDGPLAAAVARSV